MAEKGRFLNSELEYVAIFRKETKMAKISLKIFRKGDLSFLQPSNTN
jgi:hypothetical protein